MQERTKNDLLGKRLRYPTCKRSYLIQILLEIIELYEILLPKYKSDNSVLEEYPDLPVVYEKEQEGLLLSKLVHYQTVINRVRREEKSLGYFVSVEEDVLAALSMMEELIRLSQKLIPNDQDEFILSLIRQHIGVEEEFRSKELYILLGINQKRIQESLCRLHDGGKVERVSGSRYQGYNYKLI